MTLAVIVEVVWRVTMMVMVEVEVIQKVTVTVTVTVDVSVVQVPHLHHLERVGLHLCQLY